jgi:hypothetical protein
MRIDEDGYGDKGRGKKHNGMNRKGGGKNAPRLDLNRNGSQILKSA